jgi:hypothetical protein
MSPAGVEPTIPANERPQTHALDRADTGIGEPDFTFAHVGWGLVSGVSDRLPVTWQDVKLNHALQSTMPWSHGESGGMAQRILKPRYTQVITVEKNYSQQNITKKFSLSLYQPCI